MEVGKNIVKGSAILVVGRVLARLIGLVNTIIVARILSPSDFGVVAVALTVVWLVEGVSNFRVSNALVSEQNPDDAYFNTAWTLGVLRGIVVFVLLFFSAGWIGVFMDDERLTSVIQFLALSTFLLGVVNPKFIQFEKDLDLSRLFFVQLIEKIVMVAVSITLAYMYRSYWAIVAGMLSGYIMHVVMSYVLAPYRPHFTLQRFDRIWRFAGWLTGESIVNTIARRLDNFFLGNALGLQMAGIAYMGDQLTRLPTSEFLAPVRQVLFAGLAKFGENIDKLRANVLESIAILAGIALPMAVGFALVADDFVLLFLGEKWVDVVPLLRFVIIALGFAEVLSIAPIVAMVRKNTQLIFYRSLVYSFIRLPILLTGIYVYGFIGFIVARVLTDTILVLLNLGMLKRLLDISFFSPLRVIIRTLVSVVAMVLIVLAWQQLVNFVDGSIWGYLWQLSSEMIVGTVTYCLVHYATWILASKPQGVETRFHDIVAGVIRG